jgi:hypothetical protein
MRVSLDISDVTASGASIAEQGVRLTRSLEKALADLDGTGAMAGTTSAGVAWANRYDKLAAKAVAAMTTLAGSLVDFGVRLQQVAANRRRAIAYSTPGGNGAGAVVGLSRSRHDPVGRSVPSAEGGNTPEPPVWHLIRDKVGYAWPDGHEDRMTKAHMAWTLLASTALYDARQRFNGHVSDLTAANMGPEFNALANTATQLTRALLDAERGCYTIAIMCMRYSSALSYVHSEVRLQLEQIAVNLALAGLIDTGLVILSAGAGDLADAARTAKVVEEAAGVIQTVRSLIEDFIDIVRALIKTTEDGLGLVTAALNLGATLLPSVDSGSCDDACQQQPLPE